MHSHTHTHTHTHTHVHAHTYIHSLTRALTHPPPHTHTHTPSPTPQNMRKLHQLQHQTHSISKDQSQQAATGPGTGLAIFSHSFEHGVKWLQNYAGKKVSHVLPPAYKSSVTYPQPHKHWNSNWAKQVISKFSLQVQLNDSKSVDPLIQFRVNQLPVSVVSDLSLGASNTLSLFSL